MLLNGFPCLWSNLPRLSKEKVQSCRISLGRHTRPLAQRVKRYVHVVGAVAALIACSGPDKVRSRLETEGLIRILNVDAVKIGIVRLTDFGTVQFRAADKEMNQVLRAVESGKCHQLKERRLEASFVAGAFHS